MGRGRPINYDSHPTNGISFKGFELVTRDIERLESFVMEPADPVRKQIVSDLLSIGEAYAASLVGTNESVDVSSSINAREGSKSEGWGIVKATGRDVLFWEFGTGIILMPGSHPQAAEFGIDPTSFSASHAGWLVGNRLKKFHGKWPYNGTWVVGQAPRMAMWRAAKLMRESIPGVISQTSVFDR